MKPKFAFILLILVLLAPGYGLANPAQEVSGQILGGFRILEIKPETGSQSFTVYRGDYIKFRLPQNLKAPDIRFPLLNQTQPIVHDLEKAPYFKMKTEGVQPFSMGNIQGEIRVIEYLQANYRALTVEQADEFIRSAKPLILDVRTPGEFKGGHLKDAVLIPVQSLQKRIHELEAHKDDPVLVYCATGNRSTVASKILIDAGFKDILNLKRGIAGWAQKRYPIVK